MVIEWKSILLVVAIVISALIIIKLVDKKLKLHSELKRKIFHMSMGLTMLTFPYIFTSWVSVGILGILAILMMLALKKTKLKDSLGTVLYSVQRESLGEIFFTISVFVIFYLSGGDRVLFSIPILILTFADSAAALIGKGYGKNNLAQYSEDSKSIEGSFTFFVVAFMATLVPLLLWTNVGREETLIISTIVGLNVALVEMISHNGNDNLLIPLTTFAFISIHMQHELYMLRMHLLIIVFIFVLVKIASRVKALSRLAVVEAFVVGYLTAILYGGYALIPPLLLFVTVMRFPNRKPIEKDNIYDARITETNVILGMAICAIVAMMGWRKEFFMTYATCYAMHLTVNTFIRFKYYLELSEADCILYAICKGIGFIFIPSLLVNWLNFHVFIDFGSLLTMVTAIIISAIVIYFKKKKVKVEEISMSNAYMQMRIVLYLTLVIIGQQILHYNGII